MNTPPGGRIVTVLRSALVCGCIIACTTSATAQTPPVAQALGPAALVKVWLLQDCGLNTYPFARLFLENRTEVVPLLVRAYDEGPPEELRAAARQGAALAFERRQAWLRANRPQWLDDETTRAIQSASSQDSTREAVDALVAKYRQQALNGLALAGGDEALSVLERIAKSDPAYSSTAAAALARMRQAVPR